LFFMRVVCSWWDQQLQKSSDYPRRSIPVDNSNRKEQVDFGFIGGLFSHILR